MMLIIYKSTRKIVILLVGVLHKTITKLIFLCNNVSISSFRNKGIPFVMVAIGGRFQLGENFSMNNGISGNPIGCYDKCTFFVDKGATLVIGKNVGISQSAIICHESITIGDNVKIGGGVKIYDTDFHSLDPKIRSGKTDLSCKATAPVLINNNAFIGAFSIILKGITIGENSIIGAGSVVTKNVPNNQIWAGNPAKFIREI
jgi:acetyltransferase-like isoleucine patch superfamily enzyme